MVLISSARMRRTNRPHHRQGTARDLRKAVSLLIQIESGWDPSVMGSAPTSPDGAMDMALGWRRRGCIAREEVPDIGDGWEGSKERREVIERQGTEGDGGEGRGVGP